MIESNHEEILVVLNYNPNKEIVISGHKNAVERVINKVKLKVGIAFSLKVSVAFYSLYMMDAALKLKKELIKYKYNDFKYLVISNVDALPYIHSPEIINKLTLQMTNFVRWRDTTDYIKEYGVNNFIEIGPKKVLTNLLRKSENQINVYCYDNIDDKKAIKNLLANA